MPRTKEILAAVLRAEGLGALADRAATGEFDDFESPHVMPINELVCELGAVSRADLAQRARDGEWDATEEEAEEWARKGFPE